MKLKYWASAFAVLTAGLSAQAQAPAATGTLSNDVLRIGVLTDISGVYADISGKGAVEAVKMAVEDFGGKMFGKNIEVVSADHQNKADVGAAKAREWLKENRPQRGPGGPGGGPGGPGGFGGPPGGMRMGRIGGAGAFARLALTRAGVRGGARASMTEISARAGGGAGASRRV